MGLNFEGLLICESLSYSLWLVGFVGKGTGDVENSIYGVPAVSLTMDFLFNCVSVITFTLVLFTGQLYINKYTCICSHVYIVFF